MNFFKWIQLIDLIIRIFKLLNANGKNIVASTIDELKDEQGKESVAKAIADTINKVA